MKKFLSVLLVAFAVGSIVIGCNRGGEQDDAAKAMDDKAVETGAEKTAEEAK